MSRKLPATELTAAGIRASKNTSTWEPRIIAKRLPYRLVSMDGRPTRLYKVRMPKPVLPKWGTQRFLTVGEDKHRIPETEQ